MKVIVTGVTGHVGEGVLLECLQNPAVEKVLAVGRRGSGHTHPKLTELLVPDFTKLDAVEEQLEGYDACFYCAGVSSVGMSEADYTRATYETPLRFAEVLARLNPQLVLCHVTGRNTDGTEQGKVMWARVKGRAENALARLPLKSTHNYRPGLMTPMPGQTHVRLIYRLLAPLLKPFMNTLSMHEVGLAMIHCVERPGLKQVLEIDDIREAARPV